VNSGVIPNCCNRDNKEVMDDCSGDTRGDKDERSEDEVEEILEAKIEDNNDNNKQVVENVKKKIFQGRIQGKDYIHREKQKIEIKYIYPPKSIAGLTTPQVAVNF